MQSMRRALIPTRVLKQIQLMILLRIPPLPRFLNLSNDALPPRRKPLRLDPLSNATRNLSLRRRRREYRRAVLRARVPALGVERRGIVGAVEEFWVPLSVRMVLGKWYGIGLTNELRVPHLVLVKLDPHRLGVLRRPAANGAVVRVRGVALPACISHGGL